MRIDPDRVNAITAALRSEDGGSAFHRDAATCMCGTCVIGRELMHTDVATIVTPNVARDIIRNPGQLYELVYTALAMGFDLGVRYQTSLEMEEAFRADPR
jgi:hypothetical protein